MFSKNVRLGLILVKIGYLNYSRLCYQAVVKASEGCTIFKTEIRTDAYLH